MFPLDAYVCNWCLPCGQKTTWCTRWRPSVGSAAQESPVWQRSGQATTESGSKKGTGDLATRRGAGDPEKQKAAREGRARPGRRRGVQVIHRPSACARKEKPRGHLQAKSPHRRRRRAVYKHWAPLRGGFSCSLHRWPSQSKVVLSRSQLVRFSRILQKNCNDTVEIHMAPSQKIHAHIESVFTAAELTCTACARLTRTNRECSQVSVVQAFRYVWRLRDMENWSFSHWNGFSKDFRISA